MLRRKNKKKGRVKISKMGKEETRKEKAQTK